MKKLILPILALASLSGTAAMAAPLSLDVYNPQDKGFFCCIFHTDNRANGSHAG